MLLKSVMNWFSKFDTDQEGQGMVEYGLILILVSVVAIAALQLIGSRVIALLTSVANSLSL